MINSGKPSAFLPSNSLITQQQQTLQHSPTQPVLNIIQNSNNSTIPFPQQHTLLNNTSNNNLNNNNNIENNSLLNSNNNGNALQQQKLVNNTNNNTELKIQLMNEQSQFLTIYNQEGEAIAKLKLSHLAKSSNSQIKYQKDNENAETSSTGKNLILEVESSHLLDLFSKTNQRQYIFKGLINSVGKEPGYCEDSFYLCRDCKSFGVADGVGSWRTRGINSGIYSKSLTDSISQLSSSKPWLMPYELIEDAYHSSQQIQGSSTICILKIIGSKVYSGLIGDSSFLIIRNNTIIYRSKEQVHDVNFPFQLGSQSEDKPSSGIYSEHDTKENDIFVIGTDGFFDNVFDSEILDAMKSVSSIETFYQHLFELAKRKSVNNTISTPFSQTGRGPGGKIDDITLGCFVLTKL
ncbi:protein phosphatase 2C-related protein [Tieghemostelium lacteum]|uniref:Protein phosphatase 2C-related protein n=1 Tax=Tieghemostelium lacteum TaxID=361077 RepID=A0A151Z768_TIELA|nr:protein phosphatase 2C-related protein [Tieghemostelium lacteum]|eukprot:KYQ89806.1 protein phosphatase 2C-related protein [Tieghemostelium lacteum]